MIDIFQKLLMYEPFLLLSICVVTFKNWIDFSSMDKLEDETPRPLEDFSSDDMTSSSKIPSSDQRNDSLFKRPSLGILSSRHTTPFSKRSVLSSNRRTPGSGSSILKTSRLASSVLTGSTAFRTPAFERTVSSVLPGKSSKTPSTRTLRTPGSRTPRTCGSRTPRTPVAKTPRTEEGVPASTIIGTRTDSWFVCAVESFENNFNS